MELNEILAPVADDMRHVDAAIRTAMSSQVELVDEISQHIISSGGKRLRPATLALAAKACGYQGKEHIQLAAAIELVHTATLLHDDVVDGSKMRRGKQAANLIWGNNASVLVGDYLYSLSTKMMIEPGRLDILHVVASAANDIAEGEIVQLTNRHNPNISEEQYFKVIRSKTARLFEASTHVGALLGRTSASTENAMARYGLHLGNAFQLIDDVLDLCGNAEEIGKNIGDDLADGKATLPMIHAIRNGTRQQATAIQHAIENADISSLSEVLEAIESTHAIEYTSQLAHREAGLAIDQLRVLPASPAKTALEQLASCAVQRRS